jgi:FHA domain
MATCPKGHTSTATDYCDECGAPIGGAAEAAASANSSTVESQASTVEPESSAAQVCPECGAPRDGRFCEVCGHDFLATGEPGSAAPAAVTAPAAAGSTSTATDNAETAGAVPGPTGWRVVASADRAYYDRMRAAGGADAEPVEFPAFCPERRFTLDGEQMLVGRRSRSRGIAPAIDLTGPPEDAGVSHTHALFVAGPSGWSIVDLNSANGTYLNDSGDQLAANQPVALTPGDRVHVGAWTTLTVLAT